MPERLFAILLVPLLLMSPIVAGAPASTQADVAGFITALGDGDPAVRDHAVADLKSLGFAARPALVAAQQSDDPAIRSVAQQLLLDLPWYLPGDPLPVRHILADYGKLDDEHRKNAVEELAQLSPAISRDALLRLLREEPGGEVPWFAAGALRRQNDEATWQRLRTLDVSDPSTTPALLVSVGRAWLRKDPSRSRPLLERALRLEAGSPTPDDGELDVAFDTLVSAAVASHQYDHAAELLRQQAGRPDVEAPVSSSHVTQAVFNLFALHGDFGPLAGFDHDISRFDAYLGDSQILYAMARAYGRGGDGVTCDALAECAFAAGLTDAGDRYETGDFLLSRGWYGWAERELQTVVSLATPDVRGGRLAPNAAGDSTLVINARFRLARVAAAHDDDQAAADHLRLAMEAVDQIAPSIRPLQRVAHNGDAVDLAEDEIWAEIEWRYLRAARERGDQAGARQHLDKLLQIDAQTAPAVADGGTPATSQPGATQPAGHNAGAPGPAAAPVAPSARHVAGADPIDQAVDLVPLLKEMGRKDDARRLFDRAYAATKLELEADPANPEPINNLAWLCARSGERLGEAIELASKALALAPDNAAYLDTAAEAQFDAGHAAEAAKLEARALELRPDDRFMRRQLARFRGATSRPASADGPASAH